MFTFDDAFGYKLGLHDPHTLPTPDLSKVAKHFSKRLLPLLQQSQMTQGPVYSPSLLETKNALRRKRSRRRSNRRKRRSKNLKFIF